MQQGFWSQPIGLMQALDPLNKHGPIHAASSWPSMCIPCWPGYIHIEGVVGASVRSYNTGIQEKTTHYISNWASRVYLLKCVGFETSEGGIAERAGFQTILLNFDPLEPGLASTGGMKSRYCMATSTQRSIGARVGGIHEYECLKIPWRRGSSRR